MTIQEETVITPEEEAILRKLGFEPRYYLCRHPAWPDPLGIWPPTAENAERTYNEYVHPDAYVLKKWEKGPREIVWPARGEGAAPYRCANCDDVIFKPSYRPEVSFEHSRSGLVECKTNDGKVATLKETDRVKQENQH